jgi:predicted nucleic acid-binding protein
VLSWLLGEPDSARVRAALGGASRVVSSRLTLVECERALIRGTATGELTQAQADAAMRLVAGASAHWTLLAVSSEVLEGARRRFPREPLRTLDAMHLASAAVFRSALGAMSLLSLDKRVRENGAQMGFVVEPPDPGRSHNPS